MMEDPKLEPSPTEPPSSGERKREHRLLRYITIFLVILFVVIPALLGFIGFFTLPFIPKK